MFLAGVVLAAAILAFVWGYAPFGVALLVLAVVVVVVVHRQRR
jgi:hypothetical protein